MKSINLSTDFSKLINSKVIKPIIEPNQKIYDSFQEKYFSNGEAKLDGRKVEAVKITTKESLGDILKGGLKGNIIISTFWAVYKYSGKVASYYNEGTLGDHKCEVIGGFTGSLIGNIIGGAGGAAVGGAATAALTGSAIGATIGSAVPIVGTAIGMVAGAAIGITVSTFLGGFGEGVGSIIDAGGTIGEALIAGGESAVNSVAEMATGAVETAGEVVSAIGDTVAGAAESVGQAFQGLCGWFGIA